MPERLGKWIWGDNAPQDKRFFGGCGVLAPTVPAKGNAKANSVYRVVNTETRAEAYFHSPYVQRDLCVAASDAYPTYVARSGKYASRVANTTPGQRPGCMPLATFGLEADARRACDADARCVGYYAAPSTSSFALSIAPPGKCAVDWAPVQNAEPSAFSQASCVSASSGAAPFMTARTWRRSCLATSGCLARKLMSGGTSGSAEQRWRDTASRKAAGSKRGSVTMRWPKRRPAPIMTVMP